MQHCISPLTASTVAKQSAGNIQSRRKDSRVVRVANRIAAGPQVQFLVQAVAVMELVNVYHL